METIQQQIGAMQKEIKRLREELEVVKKGNFDTITCKGWSVVDMDGKKRIIAFTNSDGDASVQWNDKDGKNRISALTRATGTADVQLSDKDGKTRIYALTQADGTVDVQWLDKDGKQRIDATTHADGTSGVKWLEKDQYGEDRRGNIR